MNKNKTYILNKISFFTFYFTLKYQPIAIKRFRKYFVCFEILTKNTTRNACFSKVFRKMDEKSAKLINYNCTIFINNLSLSQSS